MTSLDAKESPRELEPEAGPLRREVLFPGDGELALLMRQKDWASTPLGPVEGWPTALRVAVRIVLTSRFSMWMAWGDELTCLYNDAYRRDTLATKHPWALGRPAREVWREIWPDIEPRIAGVLANGRATWDEGLLLYLERSGYREETYHTFSYSPLHDDDGNVRGMLCVVTEETGRLISERRVALLGRLAAEIAGSNTESGVLTGLQRSLGQTCRDLPFTLTYLFDDRGAARLVARTGFDAAAADVPIECWPLGEVFETGRALEVALDGDAWPCGCTQAFLAPLAQQGQTRAAGVLIAGINPHRLFDATSREFVTLFVGQLAAGLANAHAYELERQRSESLAELDRAKTAFFSNVSHEFRTPLTLMLGPLGGLLSDPELAPALRDELETVHRNALRLLKLVNTMLDFSKIEAGRATARFRPVDLAVLTEDLASVFRAATEKAGLRLVVDCPPLDVAVAVDRDMWENIVLNLISNAFKFTHEGEIRVSLARRGDRVELAVQDTGCGIPAAELVHVFDRFHRVEGTRGRTHEGTGIGLALVQELVRLHHGTIEVASELGLGTTFVVAIPIASGEPEAADLAHDIRAPRRGPNAFAEEAMRWLPDAGAEPTPVPVPVPRERLLVADDNADMRDYMRRLLGSRWDVEAVANGHEALAAMRAQRPDLVISDIMMPMLDGFGLIAAIRRDPALRDVPVIMLSARAGEEARVEGLQAGANDYLVKPFSSRDLLAHVETQLLREAVRAVEAHHARRLSVIFEQAPVAIAILRGPEHRFEIANPHYRQVIGGREVVGRTVRDALPEVVPQGFIELLDRVYRTGEPFAAQSFPIKLHNRDGALEEHFFDLIYQPLVDSEGRVDGIAAIGHDVTALASARRDAEAANRAKDEFLAMLGHELRNPLAPIMTALQLMRLRANVGAERERGVIERQVQHLVGLVDDLLDVSRITRGKVDLRREVIEIADVIGRAIEIVSPLLEEHRHALTVEVPRGLFVDGDPARLTQIVSNLVTNAAKYTASGGKILVSARRDGDWIAIIVVDNGIGIEASMLSRVFEAFTQAPQSFDRARGGLGLGLAIVENLVKLHGGSVGANSAGLGHGSEFFVRLPALDIPDALAAASEPPRDAVQPGDARVLVVDDNVDAANILADILETRGYRAHAVHDGPAALGAVDAFRPQVAILDLGLPIMDGFELARLLRARPHLAGTRFVAVTGYGQPQDREKTTAAGFAAHLVKPVDVEQLCEVIEQLLPGR
jgi:signal transduction histidine kinase/DNA-binding response OmpR family regulator